MITENSDTTTKDHKSNDEAQIYTVIDDWSKAIRTGENDEVLSNHAANVLIFDVLAPLQYKGADAYRKSWDEWQPTSEDESLFEIHELNITSGETVAFCHGLIKCGGTPTVDWVRATFCLRKMDSKWTIAHQHISMPVTRKGA